MSRNRFKSVVLYATAGISLLLVFVGLLFAVEHRRTQAETGAVLSALFSQEALYDVDKWGGGRTVEIVILHNPDCHICSVDGNGPDSQSWFAPSLRSRGSALSDAFGVCLVLRRRGLRQRLPVPQGRPKVAQERFAAFANCSWVEESVKNRSPVGTAENGADGEARL